MPHAGPMNVGIPEPAGGSFAEFTGGRAGASRTQEPPSRVPGRPRRRPPSSVGDIDHKESRMSTSRVNRPLAIGAAVVVLAGGAYGIVSSNSGNSSAAAPTAPIARTGSNARSGPAAGGTIGK